MLRMLNNSQKQSGFTLVEVAVVVPMIILIVVGILSLLVVLVRNNIVQSTQGTLVNDMRSALGKVEKSIDSSGAFFPGVLPSTTYKDFNEPGLTGTYKTYGTLGNSVSSTNLNSLFIEGFNNMIDPDDATKTKVIAAFKGTAPCSGITFAQTSNIASVAVLYFVKNGVLYKRTLPDKGNPAVCGTGPLIKQSCPTGTDSNTPQCVTKDEALLNNVSKFKVDYYLSPSDASAMNAYAATPAPTIDQAKSAVISITASASANGTRVSHSASLRVTRLNN